MAEFEHAVETVGFAATSFPMVLESKLDNAIYRGWELAAVTPVE